ncbi:MAG: hypothetical protein ABEI99_12185, partial [Halobaculum sp.]
TIHGTGGAAVRERVVSDLGVPASAFTATDFVLTLDADHRLSGFEEVYAGSAENESDGDGIDGTVRFGSLFDRDGATDLLDRGNSRLVTTLAGPTESYADLLDRLDELAGRLRRLAQSGRLDPDPEIGAATGTERERGSTVESTTGERR